MNGLPNKRDQAISHFPLIFRIARKILLLYFRIASEEKVLMRERVWSQRPGHVVWIGLFEPSTELLQRVQAQLRLHYLAIEDAGKAHQHPKIEQLYL